MRTQIDVVFLRVVYHQAGPNMHSVGWAKLGGNLAQGARLERTTSRTKGSDMNARVRANQP